MTSDKNSIKKQKEKIKLTKEAIIIAAVSATVFILLISLLVAVVVIGENNFTTLNKEEQNASNDSDNTTEDGGSDVDDGSGMTGGEKVEFAKVTPLVGNTTLTPERVVLLEANLVKTIENTNSKLPKFKENGSAYTDENGELVCYDLDVRDYTGMKENLIIIANSFADDGYPIDPIWYAQRLYFECYEKFSSYSTEKLLSKLKKVFLISGNTLDAVYQRAIEEFDIIREDKCQFVFEEPLAPVDLTPKLFNVEINLPFEWHEDYENFCIYDKWVSRVGESEQTVNLKGNLHIIICKMQEIGASEYDTRLAQVIYASYLANIKYRTDWLDELIKIFEDGTPDYVYLCERMNEVFGNDMNSNMAIANYYDGISPYLGGEK